MSFQQIIHQDDREKWLAERRNSIGASDCPAIMGLVSWGSATSVQADKFGLLTEPDEAERLKWGRALEPEILKGFTVETGMAVESYGWLVRDPERPWLHATPDGKATDIDVFVQAKNTMMVSEWDDGAPAHVYAQQQAEMAVTGHDHCYVAALVMGNRLRWAKIDRDEDFISNWLALAEVFWKATQNHEPFVNDGSDATHQALGKMFKGGTAGFKHVGAEWIERAKQREDAKARATAAEKERREIDALIKAEAGDCEGLLLPDGTSYAVTRVEVKAHERKASTQVRITRKE